MLFMGVISVQLVWIAVCLCFVVCFIEITEP